MRRLSAILLLTGLFICLNVVLMPVTALKRPKDDGIGARLETKVESAKVGKEPKGTAKSSASTKPKKTSPQPTRNQKSTKPLPGCHPSNLKLSKTSSSGKDLLVATVAWYKNATVAVLDEVQGAKTWREKAKFAMKLRRKIRLDTVACLKELGYRATIKVYLIQYSLTRIFKSRRDFKGPGFDYLVSKYAMRNPNRIPTYQYLNRAYKDILGSKAQAESMFHPWLCSRQKRKCVLQISHMEQV